MPKRELIILDVGHGNCTLLRDTDGIVVFDTGRANTLFEFLKKESLNKIEVVLLSHADQDHIGGLYNILTSKEFEVGTVRLNPDSLKGQSYRDLMFILNDHAEREIVDFVPSLSKADNGKFNQGDVNIEILAPSRYIAAMSVEGKDRKGRKINSNTISAVIRLVLDGKPIALIPGDIDSVGLDSLIEDDVEFNAPIVIFPHHGGKPGGGKLSPFVEKFCDKTNPKIIVFSIGRISSGRYDNPNPDLISLVLKKLPEVKLICTQLSKHCSLNLPNISQEHLTDKYAEGKPKNHCCAGTMEFDLDNIKNGILPEFEKHKKFIEKDISDSLCMKQNTLVNIQSS